MNEKQLVLAWMMYAENNDYIMCGPMTGITGSPRYDWVGPPRDLVSGAAKTSNFTAEEEIRGIETGTLFPYYKKAKLVNCPTDKRSVRAPTYPGYGGTGGYRTYSLPYHLNAPVIAFIASLMALPIFSPSGSLSRFAKRAASGRYITPRAW